MFLKVNYTTPEATTATKQTSTEIQNKYNNSNNNNYPPTKNNNNNKK